MAGWAGTFPGASSLELRVISGPSEETFVERSRPSFDVIADRKRARRISAVIRFAERRLRRRFPILNWQNLIGTTIFVVSAVGFIGSSALYLQGTIPAWACVIANALFASLLHELEHDLIHNLYFNRQPVVQNAMMAGVWLFRGNIISPWYRRKLHLLHHKDSGQHTDLEEQLIGNGLNYGILRIISACDGFLSGYLRGPQLAKIPVFNDRHLLLSTLPFMLAFTLTWYSWIAYHVLSGAAYLLGTEMPWPAWIEAVIPYMNAAAVIYLIPNFIRQASINFISSSMHYFGDVEGIIDQTQVLNAWYFWPLQIFCFNFGSTHGIHHFVVGQPFYLRQMVAGPAHAAMRRYGVRFNDLGTFARANRLGTKPESIAAAR